MEEKMFKGRINAVRDLLGDNQKDLLAQAIVLGEKYREFQRQENASRYWDKQSNLTFRARLVGNSLLLEWYAQRWVGTKAKNDRRPIRLYIRKERGSYTYKAEDLTKHTQPWEAEMVLSIEREAKKLRHLSHHNAEIFRTLGRLNRILDVSIDNECQNG